MSEDQDFDNLFGSEEEKAPDGGRPSNSQGNEPQTQLNTQPNDLEEDLFGSEADDADILKAGAVDDLADERVGLADDGREDEEEEEEEAPEEEKQVVGEPLHYRKLDRPRPRGTKVPRSFIPSFRLRDFRPKLSVLSLTRFPGIGIKKNFLPMVSLLKVNPELSS